MSDKQKEIDFNDLRFIRIFDPVHIPKEYVEQIRERDFDVDSFYKYQKIICTSFTEDGIVVNPLNLLYVLVDKENLVKGFLWAVISPLSQDLVINSFSLDKAYWFKGKAVKLLEDKVKEIMGESGFKKCYWLTTCPKHSEKHGFKRSKNILMEYSPQEDKDG